MNGSDEGYTSALFAARDKADLIGGLTFAGARVIELPVPRIVPVVNADPRDFGEFDWIVFSGLFPTRAFFELPSASDSLIEFADSVRIGVVGNQAADMLRKQMIHCDLISDESRVEAIASDLESYEGGLGGIALLAIAGDWNMSAVSASLSSAGADVSTFCCCAAKYDDPAAVSRGRSLALGGAIDAVHIESPEEAEFLPVLFAENRIAELFCDSTFECADALTALRVRELGIAPASIRVRTKKDGHEKP